MDEVGRIVARMIVVRKVIPVVTPEHKLEAVLKEKGIGQALKQVELGGRSACLLLMPWTALHELPQLVLRLRREEDSR